MFFDTSSIQNGRHDDIIFPEIEKCDYFLPIIVEGTLDNCSDPNNWVRREIEFAIKNKNSKQIIPIFDGEFSWPDNIHESVKDIRKYNGLKIHYDMFEKSIEALEERFLDKTSSPNGKSTISQSTPNSKSQVGKFVFANGIIKKYNGQESNVDIPERINGEIVRTIGRSAFEGCEKLKSISIPNTVTNIENYAFSHCVNLTTISLPNLLNNINNFTFEHCLNLRSIQLPKNLRNIGCRAFFDCKNLLEIKFPTELERIGDLAFTGCEKITQIDIPAKCKAIGYQAFRRCLNLKKVVLHSDDVKYEKSSAFEKKVIYYIAL